MFSKYDLHEAMKLRVGETPFEKPPTPQQMRIGLARVTYYSTVIRSVKMLAEQQGWNGEDTMTAIAFYATLQLEVAQQSLHDAFAKMPMPPVMVPESTYRAKNGACDPPFVMSAEDMKAAMSK